MSEILKIDQDAFEEAKNNYEEYAQRMESLRSKLEGAVGDIRGGWISDGGNAFFKKFDEEWLKNFNDYIAVMEHMADNMQIAKNKYQSVFEATNKLSLS